MTSQLQMRNRKVYTANEKSDSLSLTHVILILDNLDTFFCTFYADLNDFNKAGFVSERCTINSPNKVFAHANHLRVNFDASSL